MASRQTKRGRPSRDRVTIGPRGITLARSLIDQLGFQPVAVIVEHSEQVITLHAIDSDALSLHSEDQLYPLAAPRRVQIHSAKLVRHIGWAEGVYPAKTLKDERSILVKRDTTALTSEHQLLESLDLQRPYTVAQIAELCGIHPSAIYRHIEAGHLETDAAWTTEFREVIARGAAVRAYLQWRLEQYGWIKPPRPNGGA